MPEATVAPAVERPMPGQACAFVVMELELIESSFYLRTDPDAPARFARAVDDWFWSDQSLKRNGISGLLLLHPR